MRFAAAMSSGILLVGILIFLGFWLGDKLDKSMGTSPLFILVFVLLGFGLGLWYLMTIFRKLKP